MNKTLKTVLLTVLTLSLFTIALIEVSGVSQKAIFNKAKSADPGTTERSPGQEKIEREKKLLTLPKTTMKLIDSLHDFGKIQEGDKVRFSYGIENTGNEPLFIANIAVECGCTAPDFPEEPVLPGRKTYVTLEFNSAGKGGKVLKKAHIIANTDPSRTPIAFTADVQ